jgi:hypothetical protein
MYKLFLDDIRSVSAVYPDQSDSDFVIVRSFEDFKKVISEQGLPSLISFDNDLGQLAEDGSIAPDGYACAKWLVYESGLDISTLKFYVHSANIVARDYIKTLLDNYIKHLRTLKEDASSIISIVR